MPAGNFRDWIDWDWQLWIKAELGMLTRQRQSTPEEIRDVLLLLLRDRLLISHIEKKRLKSYIHLLLRQECRSCITMWLASISLLPCFVVCLCPVQFQVLFSRIFLL